MPASLFCNTVRRGMCILVKDTGRVFNRFPPFFTLQPHAETRVRQIALWRSLILNYFRCKKTFTLDIRETHQHPLFNNKDINRKLDMEFVLAILSDLQRTQNAAPVDKQRCLWKIYWHTIEEWSYILYDYITMKGGTNSVFSLYELTQGEEVQEEEFYCLDDTILIKALTLLQQQEKCELMLSNEERGVKFF
ncbi:hypothetical protein FQA39_LY06977 [Lamprigera yunnana]|nr:hypothetical protein FQA39_LY06977 [Lamprigera yunnana]